MLLVRCWIINDCLINFKEKMNEVFILFYKEDSSIIFEEQVIPLRMNQFLLFFHITKP